MVGANKNQSIHEVLTDLLHLDKHKPYGGLSLIFAGDLKQLGNPTVYNHQQINIIFRTSKGPIHFQETHHSWEIKSS